MSPPGKSDSMNGTTLLFNAKPKLFSSTSAADPDSVQLVSLIIGELERANLVVQTARFFHVEPTIQLCIRQDYALLFILHTASSSVRDSSWQENSPPFYSIRCSLRCLTEAVPLSNLRGSKVQVVNRLGWLVQIQSLCARSSSPKIPCLRLL